MTLKKELVIDGLKEMLKTSEISNINNNPSIPGFHFNRDLGLKYTSFNYNKDNWFGNYRWFELFQNNSSLNFVFFDIRRADDRTKNGSEQLNPLDQLVVGCGTESQQYLSLLLDFGKNIVGKPNKKIHILHDGDLSLWKPSPLCAKEVREEVEKEAPFLFPPNIMDMVWLGKITERKKYSFNHEDVSDMLLRLAVYAHLLRKIRIGKSYYK